MPRIIDAFTQFFDYNGDPLVDGLLKFVESGTNNTDKDTFADIGETIANTNPVVLDGAGRCPNVFGTGAYNVISYTSASVQIQQFDPVGGDPVEGAFASWNAITIYGAGAGNLVTASNGKYYRSIVSPNQNQDPTTSPSKWEEVTLNQIWNASVTYNENDQAFGSDGNIYTSRADANLNNDPTASAEFWNKITGNLTAETLDYTFSSDADKTLTSAENRYGRVAITGSVITAARNLIVSDEERVIYVQNDEGFPVTVKTVAGTGISVGVGVSMQLLCDGVNVINPSASFRGALVRRTASQSILDITDTAINFDAETYDTDAVHDNVTNNTRLTVPAGVTRVKLTGQVTWAGDAVGYRRGEITKNGSFIYDGAGQSRVTPVSGTNTSHGVESPTLSVVGGDYFELSVYQTSGGALSVSNIKEYTWFAMEIIE